MDELAGFPAGSKGHVPRLLSDPAGDDRDGAASAAWILLVGARPACANLVVRWYLAGTDHPELLRTDRGHRDFGRIDPGQAGHHRPAADLFDRHPRSGRGPPATPGELEIGIAGIGVAAGYLNREELTRKKFIADFLAIPNNPSKRIYRTGDLGRFNDLGEIEYHGRIDTQVKIRGYRIELIEIESVLLDLPEIAQAVVTTYEPQPGQVELVAYYALKQDASILSLGELTQALRSRLPRYMVPAYLEGAAVHPDDDRQQGRSPASPKPKRLRLSAATKLVAKTDSEHFLALALAEVLHVDHVSTEDHFFDDPGRTRC